MFEDKTLVCRECGNEFVFTASEQQFYADKGFQNEPGRCKACRDKRKGDRPVYCRACFEKQRMESNRW